MSYRCIPIHLPLAYLNHPTELAAEEVCHVVVTTNIRMNRMATWLESDTGGTWRASTHLNSFRGFNIDHSVVTKWIVS
jgi:hypothetical protein